MEQKTNFEDIGDEPRELRKDEGKWLKKAKNKFKAGENTEGGSEEDEKKRKDGKGKEEEITQGKSRKMIKKVSNNNNKKIGGKGIEERDNEEENEKWMDSKGKKGNPNEKRESKDNNNNATQGLQEKKKYVAGKVRIVEGTEGPTPKMIEIGNRKGGKKKVLGKGKSKKRAGKKGWVMDTGVEVTQLESEVTLEEEQGKGVDFTQTEGSADGNEEDEEFEEERDGGEMDEEEGAKEGEDSNDKGEEGTGD